MLRNAIESGRHAKNNNYCAIYVQLWKDVVLSYNVINGKIELATNYNDFEIEFH